MWNQFIHGIPDIVALFLLFGFSIFIHEFGHFIVAKWCGCVIQTFSIGFGPALWKRKIGGITYKIGILPLGGYVALPQLDPSGMEKIQGKQEDSSDQSNPDEPTSYPPISPWKKILVSLAGPLGNILFASVLAWIIFAQPTATPSQSTTDIGYVATNSASYAAGLRPGDRVIEVAGASVATWDEMREEAILRRKDGHVEIRINRAGQELELTLEIPGRREGIPFGDTAPGYEPVMIEIAGESNAARAGLRPGDRLSKLDGIQLVSSTHLDLLSKDKEGEQATLTIIRDDQEMTIPVTLPIEGASMNLPPVVGRTIPESAADTAGLKHGDIVTAFNGVPVIGRIHLSTLVQEHGSNEAMLTIERDKKSMTIPVTPTYFEEEDRYLVGIEWALDPGVPWMRYKRPWAQIKNDARGILRILRALVTPGESSNAGSALGGPVMIFAALWAAIKVSFLNALGFLRFLNVNLAILNLLPLPLLDGGHIVFSLWEIITRRKPHPKVVSILVNIFAFLLIGVFLLLTIRDVDWLFPRIRESFKAPPAAEAEK